MIFLLIQRGVLVQVVQETAINTVHLNGFYPYGISFSTRLLFQRCVPLLAIKQLFF